MFNLFSHVCILEKIKYKPLPSSKLNCNDSVLGRVSTGHFCNPARSAGGTILHSFACALMSSTAARDRCHPNGK